MYEIKMVAKVNLCSLLAFKTSSKLRKTDHMHHGKQSTVSWQQHKLKTQPKLPQIPVTLLPFTNPWCQWHKPPCPCSSCSLLNWVLVNSIWLPQVWITVPLRTASHINSNTHTTSFVDWTSQNKLKPNHNFNIQKPISARFSFSVSRLLVDKKIMIQAFYRTADVPFSSWCSIEVL